MTGRNILIFYILISFLILSCGFIAPHESSATLQKADKIVVLKSKRLLLLVQEGEIVKAYKVALGKKPVGQKMCAGDKKTPEGTYTIDSRNADSKFHKALHISYPNETDLLNAHKKGVSPGGDIMIHGLPNHKTDIGALHRSFDWTDGCIAVTNSEIEEIWQLVPDGTPIEIKP